MDLRVRPPAPAENLGFFKTLAFTREFEKWDPDISVIKSTHALCCDNLHESDPDISPTSEISQNHDPSIPNGLILK